MHIIHEHEFVVSPQGELALMFDLVSMDGADEPVLLISKHADRAFLRRAPGDTHQIDGINPAVIDAVREAGNIVVLEMIGEKITHSYDVPVAILEGTS